VTVAHLLPRDVVFRECIDARESHVNALDARERECTNGFSAPRLAEFATGRWCAREALRDLGAPEGSLLIGDAREPLWPQDFVGSVTHARHERRSYCASVVCRTNTALSLGLDAEYIDAIDRDVWSSFMSDAELANLQQQSPEKRALAACALWSAKEAFFKCQFPLTRRVPDYKEITLQLTDREFTVVSGSTLRDSSVAGRYGVIAEGLVAAVVSVQRR
jgi:4'-phosphopantetheinyl transferase EntD